jgi:asparagine synthetase B (glutamine-hydrolysing)
MEYRCPFYDRRLVEFAFHVPLSLRISRGANRLQIKRALARDLPPELLERTTKARFTQFTGLSVADVDHDRAIARLRSGLLLRQSWLNEEILSRWASETHNPMQRIHLHRMAHIEQWLASLAEQIAAPNDMTGAIQS